MRAFINRDDIDFGLATELTPAQEWSLTEASASIEYGTRLNKFQSVSSLTLYFPSNGGAPCTRLHFVGLRGEVSTHALAAMSSGLTPSARATRLPCSQGSGLKREAPLNVVYESKPQPQDHRVGGETSNTRLLQ